MPTEKRARQKEGQRARREAALAAARRRQRKRQIITFAILSVVVIGGIYLIAGRGGGKKEKVSSKGTTTTTATTATTVGPTGPLVVHAGKDAITIDRTDPSPTALVTKDLTAGTGQEAKLGDSIEVNYALAQYRDGKAFDSTFDRGQTATFELKEGGLIDGWIKGIPGMKVGGRRELIVPASLAYGDSNPSGGPSGPLVFIIDLVAIK